jgi:hypothetical protein
MHRGHEAFALSFFFSLALPLSAAAQVAIDEVMYNPSGADTGREWIELYNAGQSDVTLVGGSGKGSWRINDGSNHTLTDPSGGVGRGSLVVPAGGYLVVSNDPATFLNEYTSGTYSVVKSSISLNNTGATISLVDGNGATIDNVAYTKDMGGSDDGTSLQKQADGSWLAALPTPGMANATKAYAPQQEQQAATSSSQTSTSTPQTPSRVQVDSYVAPPVPLLFANAGPDRTVIVGADVEFDASAYDKSQTTVTNMVRFTWNFGDGTTAEGAAVLHHFSYPGTYVVILTIAQDKTAASDRLIVVAEPAALSFEILPDGGIAIRDLAGHDLDLSGWLVKQSGSPFAPQFFLPEHSLILSGGAMRISSATLGFRAGNDSSLEYPNGTLALGAGQSNATTQAAQQDPVKGVAPLPVAHANARGVAPAPKQDATVNTAPTSSELTAAAASARVPSTYLYWLGAFALASVAAAAAYAVQRYAKPTETSGWDIVEERGE